MSGPTRLPGWLRGAFARQLARPIASASTTRVRRACLYKLDRLGDFVLATGALRRLVGHFGAANCRLVISAEAAPLAALEFPDVERWTAPATANGVWRELRPLRRALEREWAGERFDTVVCLRHARSLYHDVTLTWLAAENWHGLGARPSATHLTSSYTAPLADNYPATAEVPWNRELLAHRAVVSAALGRPVDFADVRPRFTSVHATRGDYLLVCPFSSSAIRDYPGAHLAAALRELASAGELPPVVFSSTSAQRPALDRLVAHTALPASRVSVRTEDTLPEFVRLVAGSRAVLTMDSAGAHLATALEKPSVIVFGGGHPGQFCPWGDGRRQHWLTHPLPCFGCDWHCIHAESLCLTQVPPARVAQALRTALAAD